MSIASLEAQIREVEEKIETCKRVKEMVQNAQSSIQPKQNSWGVSYLALSGNEELKDVKKTDVFEGEMADALKQKVADVCLSIEKGREITDNLLEALKTQNTYLDQKIQELEAEKRRLEQELAAERARQAAARAAAARARAARPGR